MSKKVLIVWILLFLGLAVAMAYYLNRQMDTYLNADQKTSPSGNALLGGYFALRNTKGLLVTPQMFQGRYMLLYFGYSFCPDICPTGLENMSEAMTLLGTEGKKVQPLFITVDPKRDTKEQLAQYMESFHPSFMALTGSKEEVDRAVKAYRVYASPVEDEGASDYLVDHSSIVYLMGLDGKFITHFTHQTPGDEMAFRIREIIQQ